MWCEVAFGAWLDRFLSTLHMQRNMRVLHTHFCDRELIKRDKKKNHKHTFMVLYIRIKINVSNSVSF